jgi:hypothetical protein
MAQRPTEFVFERREKLAPVQKLGQVVNGRELAQLIGGMHQVGDVGIGQHAAAVRHGDALDLQDSPIGQPQLHRRLATGANQRNTLADIVAHRLGRDLVGPGLAAVLHQVGEMVGRAGRRPRRAHIR